MAYIRVLQKDSLRSYKKFDLDKETEENVQVKVEEEGTGTKGAGR